MIITVSMRNSSGDHIEANWGERPSKRYGAAEPWSNEMSRAMSGWYHSGIEGYCKSAASVMGMHGSGGWNAFGSDLFPSRFDRADKATKTWTLSRYRRGTGNRLSAFEAEWLSEIELEDSKREELAIDACVKHMTGNSSSGSDSLLAALLLRGQCYDFAQQFSANVLPAIAKGLAAEGYHSSDITRAVRNIDEHVGSLKPGGESLFCDFAKLLVAVLIYGPDSPLSANHPVADTIWWNETPETTWLSESGGSIMVSQLFSRDLARIGYSERFEASKTIFFGRSGAVNKYVEACNSLLSKSNGSLEIKRDDDKVIFPIFQSHRLTSSAHGALLWQATQWHYLDFSSNGSAITRQGITRAVHDDIVVVNPGDMIHLGTCHPNLDEAKPYQQATTILVSLFVDERSL